MNIIRKIYEGETLLAVVVDELPASCAACDYHYTIVSLGSEKTIELCKPTGCMIFDKTERAWHCPLKDADFPLE